MTKLRLCDVDGTVPGRAALIIVNLDDIDSRTGMMQNLFVEGEYNCTDPHLSCQALWESTKDDWPNHQMTIVQNPRAHYLMAARNMRGMGFGKYRPQDFLEGR